jgi:hypothetical protein
VVCPSQEIAVQRVRSLLCGYTKAERERRFIVVLKCFVDDSGSDEKADGIFVLAGYVMSEARWEDFAERWDAVLKRAPAIEYCHMAEIEELDKGPFKDIRWDFRELKVKALSTVIRDCCPVAVESRMYWKDYQSYMKGKVDPRLDNPYAVLFFKILASIAQIQIDSNKLADFGFLPVEFVFDDQGEAGLQCLKWWQQLKEKVAEPHRTIIANSPQFKDDRALNPLQAADMLAWHIRRGHHFPNEDRGFVRERLNSEGICQYEVSAEELQGIVHAFNNDVDKLTI